MVVNELESTIAMLNRAGIAYERLAPDVVPDADARGRRAGTAVEIQIEDLGYIGFFTVLGFDDAGRLVSVGAWE
jgi:hypothetical protein